MESFLIVEDARSGMIRVAQRGFWTPAIADDYFEALRPIVRRIHDGGGLIRIFSDRRECPVPPPETVLRAGYHAERLFISGDKVALIVQSSLVKLQIRRIYPTEVFATFLSPTAAEMWLSAFCDHGKPLTDQPRAC